jgi:hypothetical protein
MEAAAAPTAFFAPRRERRRWNCARRQLTFLRVAAQARWIKVALSQGAPLRIRAERRFPALSSILGWSLGDAPRWGSYLADLGGDHLCAELADAGNGAQYLQARAKGARCRRSPPPAPFEEQHIRLMVRSAPSSYSLRGNHSSRCRTLMEFE